MKSKAYSTVLLTALFLNVLSMPSQAATIAGTTCPKVGTTKTTGGVKYFCVKSGKKLVWNKGTAVKATSSPKPSVSATPSPTQSATQSSSPSKSATPSASVISGLTKLTLEEVKKHDSGTSCWSIVYGNVFDLTKWITKHPGGASVNRAICGKDGSDAFEGQHAGQGKPANQLSNYYLGKLGESIKL
jgi:cytochrome b involved in lipid metabolism